jgi:hypothetical protein
VAAANLVTPVDDASLRQQQFNLTLQSPRAMPLSPKKDNLLPPSVTAKADYSIALPRPSVSETLHFSGMSYDNTVAPSPSFPTFIRSHFFHHQTKLDIEIEQPTVGPKRNNLPLLLQVCIAEVIA